jgi:hypothetical protein
MSHTQKWEEVRKVAKTSAVRNIPSSFFFSSGHTIVSLHDIFLILQHVQGQKVTCFHVAEGIVLREKHLEKMYREAINYEIAARCSNTSTTKLYDRETALNRLFDLARDGFWPGDSLNTVTRPAGTGGGRLIAFHHVRVKCAIGKHAFCIIEILS